MAERLRNGLLVLVGIAAVANAWDYASDSAAVDYYQFWLVGHVLSTGDDFEIYSEDGRAALFAEYAARVATDESRERERVAWGFRDHLTTNATPLLYAALWPFASDDYDASFRRYRAFSFACLLASVLGLCFLLRYSLPATVGVLVLWLFALEPFYAELRVVNVTPLQVGLLVGFLWIESRPASLVGNLAGGAVLSLSVLFKPTIAVAVGTLGLYWIASGQWRKLCEQLLGMGAGALAGIAIASLAFGGFQPWPDWVAETLSTSWSHTAIEEGNFSVSAVLLELTGTDIGSAIGPVCVGLTALLFAWALRPLRPAPSIPTGRLSDDSGRIDPGAAALAIGGLLYLMLGPLVWIHYFLLAIPASIIALRPVPDEPAGHPRRWLALLALAPLVRPAGLTELFMENLHWVVSFAFAGSSTLYGQMVWEMSRRRADDLG